MARQFYFFAKPYQNLLKISPQCVKIECADKIEYACMLNVSKLKRLSIVLTKRYRLK